MRSAKGIATYLLLFLFLISTLTSSAQKQPIRNLVFEGAGMRGIAYCGVLEELELQGLMKDIQKAGGTSAGALMALTVSLGYTAAEIREIIGSTNFKRLNDGRYFLAGGIERLQRNYGWYRGERLSRWIGSIIAKKTGDADIRFDELHRRGYKDLFVTGTCLNKQRLVLFSHETYPSMKVRDAVRISMSIPIYFGAVFIDSIGNVFKRPKEVVNPDVMVDGGFTGNFPIRIFDRDSAVNYSTLGFRIDTKKQIELDTGDHRLAEKPVTNFSEFLSAFYSMIMENLNRQTLSAADWARTVSIDDGEISPRIRRLSKEEINVLIDNGRKAMKSYLNRSF